MTLPIILKSGGAVFLLILLAGAVAIVVFIERFFHCHRAQINSTEFLNGVRNVLRRDNVVEAISICDATPGPVARLGRRVHTPVRIDVDVEEARQHRRSEGDATDFGAPVYFVFARFVVFEQQPVALGDEQRVEAAHAAVILELGQALLDIRAEVR